MVFKNFTHLALKQFDRILTRDFTARYRPDGRVYKCLFSESGNKRC